MFNQSCVGKYHTHTHTHTHTVHMDKHTVETQLCVHVHVMNKNTHLSMYACVHVVHCVLLELCAYVCTHMRAGN